MKILHAIHGFYPESAGGSESYLRDLAQEQQRRGDQPVILSGSMAPRPTCVIEREEVAGLEVLRLHRDDYYFDWHAKAWHPGVEEAFVRCLREVAPDVLHLHQWIRLSNSLIELAEQHGVPTVATLHDLYTSCPRAFRVRPG